MSTTTELSGLFFQWHQKDGLMRVPFFGIVTNDGSGTGLVIDPRVCMANISNFQETDLGFCFEKRYNYEKAPLATYNARKSEGRPYLIGHYNIPTLCKCGEFHMLPPSPSSTSIEDWRRSTESMLPMSDTPRSRSKARQYWTDFSERFQHLPPDFLHLSESPTIYNEAPYRLIAVPPIEKQQAIVIEACKAIRQSTQESLPEVWTRLFLRIHTVAQKNTVTIADILEQTLESATEGLSFLGALEVLETELSNPRLYIDPSDYEKK